MQAHHQQTFLGDAVLILIMASFLVIALTFWLRMRITGKAEILFPKTVIAGLILCASTGYFPRLIDVDAALLMGLHVLLAALAWGYALYSLIDLFDSRRHPPA